ncbi:hypothetical protein HY041_04625, partial [Candidatus Roizmanbacteria bacterium]|nr:hypothetical protein [Candidatus Roizmanbacteria bacterium]
MHTIKTLFLHHSTGANLLNEGNVRKLLARLSPEIELWDHGYSLSISQLQYITSKFAPHLFSLTK